MEPEASVKAWQLNRSILILFFYLYLCISTDLLNPQCPYKISCVLRHKRNRVWHNSKLIYLFCHVILCVPLQAYLWSTPQGNCWTQVRGTATWHLCCSKSSLSAGHWSNPVTRSFLKDSGWDSAVHVICVIVLWVAGKKMNILYQPKPLLTLNDNRKLNAALLLIIMFTGRTVYAPSAVLLTLLIPLPFISIGHQTHGLILASTPCREFRQLVSGISPRWTSTNQGLSIWV